VNLTIIRPESRPLCLVLIMTIICRRSETSDATRKSVWLKQSVKEVAGHTNGPSTGPKSALDYASWATRPLRYTVMWQCISAYDTCDCARLYSLAAFGRATHGPLLTSVHLMEILRMLTTTTSSYSHVSNSCQ
jgi:hypothetical protein